MSRTKIERLTPEREALMGIVRDEWLKHVFSLQPLNVNKAKEGIAFMYSLAKLPVPEVLVVQSPLGCQYAVNLLRRLAQDKTTPDSVWDSVRDSVGASVRDSVGASVWDSVWASVGASKLEYLSPDWHCLLGDAEFGAWSDYYAQIGVAADHERARKYRDYLRSGVWYAIFLRGVAVICGAPADLWRDDLGRLHHSSAPATTWPDGYTQYFWHGVIVPEKLVETPEQYTKADFLAERDAEVRRAIREKLGNERFFELLDVVEIDRQRVGTHAVAKEAVLWRTREKDTAADEYIQLVGVTCHSTGREYMLCVPPDIDNA